MISTDMFLHVIRLVWEFLVHNFMTVLLVLSDLAIVVYAVFAVFLWRETKKSADAAKTAAEAAKVTAEAAKQSAEMEAESRQPMVEVSDLKLVKVPNLAGGFTEQTAGELDLLIVFKNYGAVSAMDFGVNSIAYVNDENDELNRLSEPARFQIAPGADLPIGFSVPLPPGRIAQVWGGAKFKVKITADYRSPQGLLTYRYLTIRVLNLNSLSFTVLDNHTDRADLRS
jgi:hypothetical protein